VAPSYGTAEEALGHVLGNSKEVIVTTKVGPPRKPYNARKAWIRSIAKPILDRTRGLKILIRNSISKPAGAKTRPRYDFSKAGIESTVESSLKFLKRDTIDILLAHEPHPDDLVPEVAERFESLLENGAIKAFGTGIGAVDDCWAPFGTVWQSAWPAEQIDSYQENVTYLFHRVLRNSRQSLDGRTEVPAADLIRNAHLQRPDSVLLVSASTPDRLKELADAVA
ncbi:MAG: aldo/keto reductase, partial [Lacipirellulaceae bacterium]